MYELTGEEYACDGVWCSVIIQEGNMKVCMAAKERFKGEYRDMSIGKLGKSDADLAEFMKEFII